MFQLVTRYLCYVQRFVFSLVYNIIFAVWRMFRENQFAIHLVYSMGKELNKKMLKKLRNRWLDVLKKKHSNPQNTDYWQHSIKLKHWASGGYRAVFNF